MPKNIFHFLLIIFFAIPLNTAFAQQQQVQQKNYFASLRASETNVRAGPGQHYPVKFTFKAKGVPVRVISEYDNWNEIEDYEGQTGWVSQSLLTKKRTALIVTSQEFVNMHTKNNEKSRILFHLQNHVVVEFIKCVKEWCGVEIKDKKGWIKRSDLYGATDEEPTAENSGQ